MEQTAKLLAYLQVKSAFQSMAIPNQNQFTFLSKLTGIPQLWKWNEAQSRPEQVAVLPDRVLEVSHSPSGRLTVVGIDCQGNEKQQFYLLKNGGAEVEELTISPEHFHYFGGWSPCEKKIAWSSNRRHSGFFDIYVQDIATKQAELVYSFDGRCDPVCWHPDGTKLLFSVQQTNIDNQLFLFDLQTKDVQQIAGSTRSARYASVQVTKDGHGGYFVTDQERNTMALCRFSFERNTVEKLVHFSQWDIEEVKLSPDERQLAFTVNEGGISAVCLYELETDKQVCIEGIPQGLVDSLSWLNGNQLIFTVKTPVLPGDVWRYTLSGNRLERVTAVGQSEAVETLWKEPQIRTYTSFDGLEVPYFYYGDDSPERQRPVVIYVHGGPEHQIRAEFHPVIQYLAGEGFVVVAPNVRGSMGYGREYVQLDDGRKRMDAVADLAWLVKELTGFSSVDPQAVGIMGRSYGGFMVLAALTHYPDLWAAGVDIVGISHFRSFLENTGPWRRRLRECEYGSLDEHADFFDEISPLNHSDKIRVPLLVFHGRNDTRVPVSEAEQLVAEMKRRNQEVELIVFEDEGHQTEKLENHILMNQKIAEFMTVHLKQNQQKSARS